MALLPACTTGVSSISSTLLGWALVAVVVVVLVATRLSRWAEPVPELPR